MLVYTDYVLCRLLSEHLGKQIYPEDIQTYHIEDQFPAVSKQEARKIIDKMLEVENTMSAPPVEGAFDFLRWYARENDIYIITTRKNTEAVKVYCESIMDYNTYRKTTFIGTKYEKGKICRNLGITYFIDDYMKNIIDLANNGVVPMLFLRNWNRRIISRRSLLSEVVRFIWSWEDVYSLVACERDNMV